MLEKDVRLQDLLSIGYLYLVLLGIMKDGIYYGLMGINIIDYSSIMDVLLSPISYLVKNPITSIILFLFCFWILYQSKFHKKYRERQWYKKMYDVKKRDEVYSKQGMSVKSIWIMAGIVASFFLGSTIGSGQKTSKKIENKEYEMKDVIKLQNGAVDTVKIIGVNSNYIFYIKKEDAGVSILPIFGNVALIKKQ